MVDRQTHSAEPKGSALFFYTRTIALGEIEEISKKFQITVPGADHRFSGMVEEFVMLSDLL